MSPSPCNQHFRHSASFDSFQRRNKRRQQPCQLLRSTAASDSKLLALQEPASPHLGKPKSPLVNQDRTRRRSRVSLMSAQALRVAQGSTTSRSSRAFSNEAWSMRSARRQRVSRLRRSSLLRDHMRSFRDELARMRMEDELDHESDDEEEEDDSSLFVL